MASDPDVPLQTLTFSLAPSAPEGASIDSATGVFTWTPSFAQGPSTNVLIVRVTDDGEPRLTATNSFSVVVREANQPPPMATISTQTVNELTRLTVTNTASEANPHATVGYALLDPPAGVSIDAQGIIAWTPDEVQGPGTNLITTVATSTDLLDLIHPTLSATNSFAVIVNEVNGAPVLSVPSDQVVEELATLSVSASATDSDIPANPLTFGLVSAPTGMNIDATTGLITWTPSQAQSPSTNLIQVRVADSSSAAVNTKSLSVTNGFTVVVVEVNQAPVLPLIAPQTVNELTLLVVTNTAAESNVHSVVAYTLLAAPPGVIVDAHGVITWTPTEVQGPSTNLITTVATSSSAFDLVNPSLRVTNSFTVIVNEVNTAPVAAEIGDRTIDELSLLSLTLNASDGDIPPNALSFGLVSGPSGLAVDAAGVLSWTPSHTRAPSTNLVVWRVTDGGSPPLSATNQFRLMVRLLVPPRLFVQPQAAQVMLWWPQATVTYRLESTESLGQPDWQGLSSPVTLANGTNSLVVPPTARQMFYRLAR